MSQLSRAALVAPLLIVLASCGEVDSPAAGQPVALASSSVVIRSTPSFDVISLADPLIARDGRMVFRRPENSAGALRYSEAYEVARSQAADVIVRFEELKPTRLEAFLADYTNHEFADTDPRSSTSVLRQKDVFSWVFVFHDIPWTGVHPGGPAQSEEVLTPSSAAALADAYVVVDARTGEFLFAFTD